jgi:hypothetical protein
MSNTINSVSGKSCQTTLEAARPLQAENHADEMILDVKQIDNYVDSLLEYNGLRRDTKQQRVRLLLHRLYTAVTMFGQMSDEEKLIIAAMEKKLGKNFSPIKICLKERKRRKDKEKIPPHPFRKEKESKEKADKILYIAERREAFHQVCLGYVGKYDVKRLADFYRYWSEENPRTGKMRFEGKRYWNLDSRLERWMNTSYCSDNTAAEIRLDRTRKRQAKESADNEQQQAIAKQQQAIAAEREAENQQRELALEQSRQNSISLEEYAKKNPDSKLVKMLSKKGGT